MADSPAVRTIPEPAQSDILSCGAGTRMQPQLIGKHAAVLLCRHKATPRSLPNGMASHCVLRWQHAGGEGRGSSLPAVDMPGHRPLVHRQHIHHRPENAVLHFVAGVRTPQQRQKSLVHFLGLRGWHGLAVVGFVSGQPAKQGELGDAQDFAAHTLHAAMPGLGAVLARPQPHASDLPDAARVLSRVCVACWQAVARQGGAWLAGRDRCPSPVQDAGPREPQSEHSRRTWSNTSIAHVVCVVLGVTAAYAHVAQQALANLRNDLALHLRHKPAA